MNIEELLSKGWKYRDTLDIILNASSSYSLSVLFTQEQQDIRAALIYSMKYSPILNPLPPSIVFLTHIPQYFSSQNRLRTTRIHWILGVSRAWKECKYLLNTAPSSRCCI